MANQSMRSAHTPLAISAVYREETIPAYQGNPLIEQLPAIPSPEDWVRQIARYPAYDPQDRHRPSQERQALTSTSDDLLQPFGRHLQLAASLDRLLRDGYRGRNPAEPRWWGRLCRTLDDMRAAPDRMLAPYGATGAPSGMALLGPSGAGKSCGLNRILSYYPPVTTHAEYRGEALVLQQIVWMHLEVPQDGSLKALCVEFLRVADLLLGTDYQATYARPRATKDDLLTALVTVAAVHGLGLLVIDEIEHLAALRHGAAICVLNFFLQLSNRIGVPVVLVGNETAEPLLSGDFRIARRGATQGARRWGPCDRVSEWPFFIEALWPYQYTRSPTALTPDLNKALYHLTAGVLDVAVTLFQLAQIRAIELGTERITVELLDAVAEHALPDVTQRRRGHPKPRPGAV